MDLSRYNSTRYEPIVKRIVWLVFSRIFFESSIPYPIKFKSCILKLFGGNVGSGIILKPNVKIKYPWRLSIGENCWIGEGVWIDNVYDVKINNDCCLSQSAYLLTGNHDYSSETFDLFGGEIIIEDGCWIGAKAIVCPGVTVSNGAILAAGSVASQNLQANGIYQGNPASHKRVRRFK